MCRPAPRRTHTTPAAFRFTEEANMIRDLFDLAGAAFMVAVIIAIAYIYGV